MNHAAARELIAWWRGVAADERGGESRWLRIGNLGRAREAKARAAVWTRCAEQLELILADKPFNFDP